MNCPNCQKENPEISRFCMNCGFALQRLCPNCSTSLPRSATYCFNCGFQIDKTPQAETSKLISTGSDLNERQLERFIPKQLLTKLESARQSGLMEGERRIVTMLFCDVKGSTAAASQLDPEDWAEIMNNAFERLIQPVYRYEGIVARLMGDGLLAFFGAPLAHEDDPQRAVLAALEIIENIKPYCEKVSRQWGFGIDIRVGINTGLVVVGGVGSDLRMEYTALGDAINIAARMEQTAQPGTIQISEATYRLIAPLFEFENLGGIEVKGKSDPVHAYRVIKQSVEPGSLRGIQGLDSPLVGRRAEFQKLKNSIEQLRNGRGQIISVIGEAGLGKSRLMAELKKEIYNSDLRETLLWIEGRSLSYETSTPYAPFIDLFGSMIKSKAAVSTSIQYGYLEDYVDFYMPGKSGEIAPFIASMWGLSLEGEPEQKIKYLEPPQLRDGIFQAVSSLMEAIAKKQPVVLVMDDLHWIDATSLQLLEQLLPIVERNALVIVGVFRPRRDEPSWNFHKFAEQQFPHCYYWLNLEPLLDDEARQLVANLLHIEDLSENIRHIILFKAEGNPFFVEEIIRSLLDAELVIRQDGQWRATKEIDNITIPDTLNAVITARLDRLDETTKRVVQSAAVIGRQFQFDELSAILENFTMLEEALLELQRREILREKKHIPQRTFIFKHTLTQETAYNSLLLKKRRELHKKMAEYLEITYPDRYNEIARHFLEARSIERALPYLVVSGERAAHAYATQEAIGYFEQAIRILGKIEKPDLLRRAYEGLGGALTFANQITRAIEIYNNMLVLAEKRGDIPMQVSALNKLSFVTALRLGEFDKAQFYITRSDQLARQINDKVGLSELSLVRCQLCAATADFDSIVHYMGETVEISRELEADEMLSLALAHVASSQAFMLNFEEAGKTLNEGLRVARQIGDLEHEADNLASTGFLLHLRSGELQSALQSAEKGASIAGAIGAVPQQSDGTRHAGLVYLLKGHFEKAAEYFQRYLQISQKAGLTFYIADALCFLGTTYFRISSRFSDRILKYHNQALEMLKQPGGMMLGGTAWIELGTCSFALGDVNRAKEYFQNALTIPTITSNFEKPRLLVGLGSIAIADNDFDAAGKYISEASLYIENHGLKYHEPLVLLGKAELEKGFEKWNSALDYYNQAAHSALLMGMLPQVLAARKDATHMLINLSRVEEALSMQEAAREVLDEIADNFINPDLRDEFLAVQLEKTV